ncbi:hypothetical protein AB6E21_05810 [Photobacterium swingsii]|uniref:hypothetical protein n=1 Tax=Photobacterium swingsii TaxID=680026 RepID=UPI00354EF3E9
MSLILQNDRRNVLFWDMTIQGISRKRDVSSAAPLKMKKLLTQLQKYRVANFRKPEFLTYDINNKKLSIVLQALSIQNNKASILFCVMDDNAAKQTYLNTETRRRRVSEKSIEEKAEYAVHMVISLNSIDDMPNSYSCIVEDCPAVSITLIMRAFNALLRKTAMEYPSQFLQPHPDGVVENGQPEMMKTYSKVSIEGHPADDFLDSITNGKISGLVAISSYDIDRSMDSTGTITPVSRELKFSVSRTIIGHDNLGYYERVKHYAFTNECPVLRVKFTDSNNQSYSIDINSETGNMINERKFIKKLTLIDFTYELTTSIGTINLEIREKMFNALDSLNEQEPQIDMDDVIQIGQEITA